MSNGVTLEIEEGRDSIPDDKVTRELETNGVIIVDVVDISSSDERKTGGVVLRFEDGGELEVDRAEIVSTF